MKAFNKIISSLFVLSILLGFAACTEEAKYDPAEVPGNAQIYFPNTMPSKVELSQNINVKSYDVELRRIDKTNAITVNLTVKNENPNIFTIPTSVNFAAGAELAKITISYDPSKLNYDEYFPISIAVGDESLTSPYGRAVYAFTAGIPAPWKSLGMATFSEAQFIWDSWEAELQQHELDPTRYRLVDAFEGRSQYYNNVTVNNKADKYLEFVILPAGGSYTTFNREDGKYTVKTTVNGLVFYEPTNIGMTYVGNGDLSIMHPVGRTLSGVDSRSEGYWLHNIVTQWTTDGKPGVVQIAPLYAYADNNWSAHNYSQNDGIMTIVFPGFELVEYDYSISMQYLGHYIDKDDVDNAIIQFTKGADVASYKYTVVDGALNASAAVGVANEIIAGTIAAEEDTQSGYKIFPLTKAGKYTVVAVTFDENGEEQDFSYVSFEFAPAGASPWVSLGFCKYTDDVLVPMYLEEDDDPLDYIPTYDVEIFENRDNPGLFRLKNAYGAGYPYNEPGDYVESDVFIEINATDPNGVYIDMQSMGVNWGDGNVNIYSFASYYMDRGQTLEQVKAAGHCGTYKNKIITFPVDKLLVKFDGNNSLYYANSNEMWKVDMTTLRASASKAKSSFGSSLSRSFNPGKAPISLNSIQPVRVESKNVPVSVIKKNMIANSPLVR